MVNLSALGGCIGKTKSGLNVCKSVVEGKTLITQVDNSGNVVKKIERTVSDYGIGNNKKHIATWNIDSTNGNTKYNIGDRNINKLFTSRDANYTLEKKLALTKDGKHILSDTQCATSKNGIVLDPFYDKFYGESGTLIYHNGGQTMKPVEKHPFTSVKNIWNA